jgi:hypothetical protein
MLRSQLARLWFVDLKAANLIGNWTAGDSSVDGTFQRHIPYELFDDVDTDGYVRLVKHAVVLRPSKIDEHYVGIINPTADRLSHGQPDA